MKTFLGERDRQARLGLLEKMSEGFGAGVGAIAGTVDKSKGTVLQMLKALELDGCVRREGSKWFRTSAPLPARPTSTAVRFRVRPCALDRAMASFHVKQPRG